MDKPYLSDTILFNAFLDTFNLTNKVTFSTHLSQHTIDLILVKNQSTIVSGIKQGHFFFDHHFIYADLCIATPKPKEKLVSYRKLKNICDTELVEDLRTMCLQGNTIEDLVTSYNLNLGEILGKHAPLKQCKLHPCHSQPWLEDEIKGEIRVRHMKECKWKNNPTEYNLNVFYQQRRYVSNTIKQAQWSFYIEKLLENRSNFCLNNTYFVFQDTFYEQTRGAVMGSPISPIIANIFMEAFEHRAITTALHPPGYGKGM